MAKAKKVTKKMEFKALQQLVFLSETSGLGSLLEGFLSVKQIEELVRDYESFNERLR